MTAALRVTDEILLGFAAEVGADGPVTVVGGGSRWDEGGSLQAGTRELRAPAGIVRYTPAEMTVQVRAGTPVAELHAELAARGQRTALPERTGPSGGGTVGGAVAVGHNHLDRRARGTVATTVLQIRYVSAEGRIITGGGPTVKNVTGFDLPRLMTGALGTLGLLAEVILRTNPVPAVSRWFEAVGADPFAVDADLLRPSSVLWDGERVWVHLEGHGADVDAEATVLARHGDFSDVEGPPRCLPPHRWSLAPSDLIRLAGPDPSPMGPPLPSGGFVASVGVGTLWAHETQPMRPVNPAVAVVSRRLKDNFDPSGRLNPGRTPGR